MLWSGLLMGSQTTDTLTTAIDRARGTIESMPVTARLLDVGGVALLWVSSVVAATLLTA